MEVIISMRGLLIEVKKDLEFLKFIDIEKPKYV